MLLAALMLAGCAESAGEAKVQPPLLAEAAPAKLPAWRGNRALPMLPSTYAKTEAYAAAIKAWHTATTAYSRGDALAAAEGFLSSAGHLQTGPEPIAKAFAAGRCLAYENAARAYDAANRLEEAKAKFTALSDPACKHSIAAALERLTAHPPSDLKK